MSKICLCTIFILLKNICFAQKINRPNFWHTTTIDTLPPCPCDSFMVKNPDFDRAAWLVDSFGVLGYRARYDRNRVENFIQPLIYQGFDQKCLEFYMGKPTVTKGCCMPPTYFLSASFHEKIKDGENIYTIYQLGSSSHRLDINFSNTGRAYDNRNIMQCGNGVYISIPKNPDWEQDFFCY
jgi:hypothetical protein